MSEFRPDALILGHTGQDGTLLRRQLEERGRTWAGISSSAAACTGKRAIDWFDVTQEDAVESCIRELKPRCVYYLAAAHGGSSETGTPELGERYQEEIAVNTLGVIHFLEAIRRSSPDTRFLFASSSLVFAPREDPEDRITEDDPFVPAEPYAAQKLLAGMACRDFREKHGLFTSIVYLFNHESIHRRPGYFSSQVVAGIRRIQRAESDRLEVGNLESVVDWSYAGDTVNAMQLALEHDDPGDYIIASGVGHTVREFLEIAFRQAGLDLEEHIEVNPALLRRTNSCRIGDASLLRSTTGWEPTMSFEALVQHLLEDRA